MKNLEIPVWVMVDYVENNEVAYQMVDSLVTFTQVDNDVTLENLGDTGITSHNDFLYMLKNAERCVVFDSKTNDCSGFEDLVKWSQNNDLLVLVDDGLLLCVASCDREKILGMVA